MKCNCCTKKISSLSVLVSEDGQSVQITVPQTTLEAGTKYCLILAQPCPVLGYNLPVTIVNGDTTIPVHKFGFGNIEFGEDLPRCRNRIPLFYNNANEFVDLRRCEHFCYCK